MKTYEQRDGVACPTDFLSLSAVLRDLGLAKPGKEKMIAGEKMRRNDPFEWVNLANHDTKIGAVADMIHENAGLSPPRTGHLGGFWTHIARGSGADLAINHAIIQESLGAPLIFDLNQTPKHNGQGGDTLYWPGTEFDDEGGSYDLPLYTWNGTAFERRDRSQPLYTPFVATERNGGLVPLHMVHKTEMQRRTEYPYAYVSETLIENSQIVTEVVESILKRGDLTDNMNERRKIYSLVADRTVTRDGVVHDEGITPIFGNRFRIGNTEYGSIRDVVDALMLSFSVAADPTQLERMDTLPSSMPILSKEMLIILMGVLNTHLAKGSAPSTPINLHFHWGAFQMAGAPPLKDGYFSGSASRMRELMILLKAGKPEIPSMYYLLLPAAPYALWPNAAFGEDIEAANELVTRTHVETDGFQGYSEKLVDRMHSVVAGWKQDFGGKISGNYVSRFSSYDSPRGNFSTGNPQLVKPEAFDSLTMRQGSLLVGMLKQQMMYE